MRPMRLLLVEDSASDARLMAEAFKATACDVEIEVVTDGEKASGYLRAVADGELPAPHIIVLDLNLPRKNGRELLIEIKGRPSLRAIPVLVMTSSQAQEDIADVYALNANCYITKPVDLTSYINIVKSIEDFWFTTAILPESGLVFPARFNLPAQVSSVYATP